MCAFRSHAPRDCICLGRIRMRLTLYRHQRWTNMKALILTQARASIALTRNGEQHRTLRSPDLMSRINKSRSNQLKKGWNHVNHNDTSCETSLASCVTFVHGAAGTSNIGTSANCSGSNTALVAGDSDSDCAPFPFFCSHSRLLGVTFFPSDSPRGRSSSR